MVTPQRVVYFGTPDFAVPTLQALIRSAHSVVALVSQPDRPKGRGRRVEPTPTKRVALEHGIPVLQPTRLRDEAFATALRGLSPDVGVVAAYGRIIPDAILAVPRLGLINVHASLLPAYRGAAPVHRAVIAGDAETGVTIMRVVSELDAGPMLAVARLPIGPDDTSVEVERALAELGASLLVDTLDRMAGGPVTETPQDHSRATYAPKIAREESAVSWALPASVIHNHVRGLQPWPLVAIRLAGERLLLHRTNAPDAVTSAPPGTVIAARGDDLSIAAGGGTVVRVLAIQPEGRRVMTTREFLAGRKVPLGMVAIPA